MTVLEELMLREPLFHRPELGTTRADFERMISDDYWEIGASGRRYDRTFSLDTLDERHRAPFTDIWQTSDFECRPLGNETYLVTYVLLQNGTRKSRRSTIWQRHGSSWCALFHQGTLIQDF